MTETPPDPIPFPRSAGPYAFRREPTREVAVGDCVIGGANPIRIQSMTTTDTKDVTATADQAEALADAGCEIVRITAPSLNDASALADIRRELDRRKVHVPLVADIHFTPNAAMKAAEAVEKVRVNPGNFADKKRFEVREYTDAAYREEIERVSERFRPLVRRMKELGRALRIGTNHGSLSDRILNRYGDTPAGMVESAIEFLDVCEDEGFYSVVFSMKASNPQVAIHAYRLLAERLWARSDSPRYPFHVGVTEAGDGEDGRTKSAIGIGALLEDGLGETLRVSLTEHPIYEIPVARALADRFDRRQASERPMHPTGEAYCVDRHAFRRRETRTLAGRLPIGGRESVRVELCLGPAHLASESLSGELRAAASSTDLALESVLFDAREGDENTASKFRESLASDTALALRVEPKDAKSLAPYADRLVLKLADDLSEPDLLSALSGLPSEVALEFELHPEPGDLSKRLDQLERVAPGLGGTPLLSLRTGEPVQGHRALAAGTRLRSLAWPILLRSEASPFVDLDGALLAVASDLGALLCDGIGDAISLGGLGAPADTLRSAYRILQGARRRTSWTEFISCPSCGRTLFDLEEVTGRVKERTAHLPGLKIAVMGCIVNGPGEMADADFGYVGSGVGKVSLYVGQDCVVRNVPEADAPDRLVELIREQGRWQEP